MTDWLWVFIFTLGLFVVLTGLFAVANLIAEWWLDRTHYCTDPHRACMFCIDEKPVLNAGRVREMR